MLCWTLSPLQRGGGFGNKSLERLSRWLVWWRPWQGCAAAGCCCSLPVAAQAAPPALTERSLHPPGSHSGFAAINLIGHWMSMLPHPITSGKVVDLQEGGENAAVRISQVGCCFLRRSWLLNTVQPRMEVPGRNQSLLLFGSARVGFDPICIKTEPWFGMKSLGRMKSWVPNCIPFLEAQLRCWWLAPHPYAVFSRAGMCSSELGARELRGCVSRKPSSGRGGFSGSRSGFKHCSLASSPLSIFQPVVGKQLYPAKIHDEERLSPTSFLLSTNILKPSPGLGNRCLSAHPDGTSVARARFLGKWEP